MRELRVFEITVEPVDIPGEFSEMYLTGLLRGSKLKPIHIEQREV